MIHPVGTFGGASKSIIEFHNHLRNYSVDMEVLCASGSVVEQFGNNGYLSFSVKHISQFDNTGYGYYRGIRWLLLLREIAFLLPSFISIRKNLKNKNYDIIHINEVTLIPWAALMRRWADAPIVVHVRSLQRKETAGLRSRWLKYIMKKHVARIIAIDNSVRRTLPQEFCVNVIHNSMKVDVNKKHSLNTRTRFRVAIVGVLLKLKGVYEFLEAARILVHDRGLDIEFYVVGENTRELSGWKASILKRLDLAHDVRRDIEEFVAKNSLQDHIVLMGFIEDVQSIYADLDVLCFPSHLNAAGRPVFEAAFYGVPSIVAVKDPPPDTIIHGETGICIDKPDGRLLADAIERLFNNSDELKILGKNAKELANRNFDIKKNAEALLKLYNNVIAQQ
ncbi:glycosyltransferase family 4 protein [Halomonas sp. DQ26W]|uniref:glycosyltransferase family 4 protein n=1 Tax=Halomonas sp. DQ26W TaxID=2282311 RepID=UPI0011C02912|nr:glycosyltransferase family 4 protein [Halomonas sp. DQ26W]